MIPLCHPEERRADRCRRGSGATPCLTGALIARGARGLPFPSADPLNLAVCPRPAELEDPHANVAAVKLDTDPWKLDAGRSKVDADRLKPRAHCSSRVADRASVAVDSAEPAIDGANSSGGQHLLTR